MASDYVKQRAAAAAKRIDEQYGANAYGGSAWRAGTAKKQRTPRQTTSTVRTVSSPTSSYAAAYDTYRTRRTRTRAQDRGRQLENEKKKLSSASAYAAISGVTDMTQKKAIAETSKAAQEKFQAENKPFYQDMFSQDETYVDLAKKGDVAGAAANFVGTGLQALQSLYLNAWDAADAAATGNKPKFTYNLDKATYDKNVAKRHGREKSIGETISDKNAAAGLVYSLANEALSDPTEFIVGGSFNDLAKKIGSGKVGTAAYGTALQKGTLPQAPKAAVQAAESVQDASKQADAITDSLSIKSQPAASDAAKTTVPTQKTQTVDPFEQAEKQIAAARAAAEQKLEEARAGFRQYYAEYRSTTPETRRAGLLEDATAAKKQVEAAQSEVDRIAKAANDLSAERTATLARMREKDLMQQAAAREAQQTAERLSQVKQVANSMDPKSVHRADLDALTEIGENNPMITAMRRNFRQGEAQQAELFGLYKRLNETDSLDEALKIDEQIKALEKKLESTSETLSSAQKRFAEGTKAGEHWTQPPNVTDQKSSVVDSLNLEPKNAQDVGRTLDVASSAQDGFGAGDRVWAADRNNYGVIQGKNASGTYDVQFIDTATGKSKVVELDGDTIQRVDDARKYRFLGEADLPEYLQTGKKQSTRATKAAMVESVDFPIIKTTEEMKDFIDASVKGDNQGTIKAFGRVNDRLANAVYEASDGKIDIRGRYMELGADDVKHSFAGHTSAKQAGDIPLSKQDYYSIPEYLNDFDDILQIKVGKNAVSFQVGKQINGHSIITEIVSNERGSIRMKNMWGVDTEKYLKQYKKNRGAGNRVTTQLAPAAPNPSAGTSSATDILSDLAVKNNTETVGKNAENLVNSMDLPIKNTADAEEVGRWKRVWSADDAPKLNVEEEAEKARVAARHVDETDPRELKDAKELVDEIDPDTGIKSGFEKLPESEFWKLNNPSGAYNKDLSRVLDSVAGKDTKLREVLRNHIEKPIMNAKSRYAHNVKNKLDQYHEAAKELGIRQGSRESAAVQWYGEGYRRVKTNGHIEEVAYTLDDLKREFPDSWQNIQRMDQINRRVYDGYLEQINASLSKIYPNVEENAKHDLNVLKAKRDGLQNKVRAIQDGLFASPDAEYSSDLKRLMQDVQANDKEINQLQKAIESGEIFRNKRVFARKDYYHHWQEMDDGLSAIKNIFQTSADIDPRLVGVSDWTKPKSKWAGFMQARKGIDSTEDSVGGMVKYIQAAEYKINIDPEIARLRVTVRDIQNGTADTRNANKFIEWLTDYTNDLAGKTNPLDRGVQKTLIGRQAMKGLRWLNNRVKGNAIMGNFSSMVSQVYNLPNVAGYVKNPADLVAGAADAARVGLGDKKMQNILSQSGFLTERYLDHAVRQFDESVLKTPEKFLSWMMEIGDRKVAEMSWFAAYRQAQRNGLDNAVDFADDLTRRAIAGRGIGEIPLNQKSEITKLFAPFQVEVNNAYQVLKEKVKQKDALALMEIFGTTWVMNEIRKNFIDGRETGFDPVHAIQEVHSDITEQEADDGEKMSISKQAAKYAGRLAGETLSNMPAGDQIARTVLGLDETTAKNLFGEGDPTRFGTGNIGISALTAPIANLATGKDVDYLEPLANVLMPFGGAQATRTRKAAEDLNIIPKLRANIENGFTARTQPTAGAYTADNSRLKYLIDSMDPVNVGKALAFGSTATKEGQAYLAGGNKMLSETSTMNFNELVGLGHAPKDTMNAMRVIDSLEPKKENGKTVETKPAQAREFIMSLDLTTRQKQELDRYLVAGTKQKEDGGGYESSIPTYVSKGEVKAFNVLDEKVYPKAQAAFKEAHIPYEVFTKAYEDVAEVKRKSKNGELGNRQEADAKRSVISSLDLTKPQKDVLNDLLVSGRIPTSFRNFSVEDLPEAAQNKWQKAKQAGFTEREFGDVWRTLGKYKKTKDRLSAVVALGYPEADAEFFVKLYTEKTATSSGDWKLPVTPGQNVWVSSPYGSRSAPTAGASTNHEAVDIAASAGEPVFAAKSGIVTAINKRGYGGGYGTWVQVDHGDGYVTQYNHMSEGSADGLNVGDIVKGGQEVGLVGSTGNSSGPHLDFKMWKNGQSIDPLTELYGY
ncbi:peptidoglycan DD-metalloendopeptidase family protein [Butyricicoccus sp. Marseille-Q5471]|uniref:peptidoglycan DD-metalloendopeptidase family protein n=1 Tax=Butyricicoccus sp. Marseille-Q5471 TaxID=3039493 RepID=UPI0024BC3EBF|nr:peptidoglycan DD-metalloendopeptidase family protein [Butyricicoccus sp. Marseille-Q5471]